MEKEKEFAADCKNTKNRRAFICITVIILFTVLTAGLGIMGVVCPDREFSEAENRVLAKPPVLSFSSLTDGTFMTELEDYLADQFPLRDSAISLKTAFDRIMGKREENGVYIGKNGFLFDFQTAFDESLVSEKTALISEFSKNNKKAKQIIAIIPNSTFMYEELLPYGVDLPDQQNQIQKIYSSLEGKNLFALDSVPTLNFLKDENTLLYYKTDHHWTTEAAFGVFSEIGKKWKLDKEVKYEFYSVTDSFEGTLASTSGMHDSEDKISICIPENSEGSYVVNYEAEKRKTASLFDGEKLEQKNKYEVFLSGNFGKISVKTTAQNTDKLLIIKDSYANCMIPMFTPHFSEIVIVDPRYMTDSIESVISEYSFTHILFLYNLNTFLEDTTLTDALTK